MTRDYAEITGIGADKTGIVAGVTSVLFEREVNIRTSTRTSARVSSG